MIIGGIDPGNEGALAFLYPDKQMNVERIDFIDMPVDKKQKGMTIDLHSLIEDLKTFPAGITFCVVEHIQLYKGDIEKAGIAKFVAGWGAVLGALNIVGIEYDLVRPTDWQFAISKPKDKSGSIFLAEKLYPFANLIKEGCRTPSDGRADALLIAHYALLTYKGDKKHNAKIQ